MDYKKEDLPKSQVKINCTISASEMDKYLDKAAREISKQRTIKGFRPGKATRKAVELEVGKDALWREASVIAMPDFLQQIVDKEGLKTVGSPEYDIKEIKPEEDIEFTAVLNLMPTVKLPNLDDLSVEKEKIEIKDEHVEKALDELARAKAKEKIVLRKAKKTDRVDISLEVKKDGKVVDKSDKVSVYIGEGRFIPGFEDALIGMEKGEEKEFKLKFPAEYPNKELANSDADFKVKVLDIYEVEFPEKNDEFAQGISNEFKTIKELREYIKEDLRRREEDRVRADEENRILDVIIKKSEFSDIPDVLVNSEAKSLLHEFEFSILRQGVSVDDYLKQIGKTKDQLLLDMVPKAIERVKASLVMSKVVEDYKIKITEEELNAELDKIESAYKDDNQMIENLQKPETKQRVHNIIVYNKTMDLLREKMLRDEDKKQEKKTEKQSKTSDK